MHYKIMLQIGMNRRKLRIKNFYLRKIKMKVN